jgi:hypothetical protein
VSRTAGAAGLVFAEAMSSGKFVTYGLDREVERVYRAIERDYPRLQCAFDNENKEHTILEHCKDGRHRLVLARPACIGFPEDIVRLQIERANSEKFDPLKEIDEAEKAVEKRRDERLHEAIGDAGEKLAHAFAQDGLTVRPRMTPQSIALKRRRALQNFEAPKRTMSNR